MYAMGVLQQQLTVHTRRTDRGIDIAFLFLFCQGVDYLRLVLNVYNIE